VIENIKRNTLHTSGLRYILVIVFYRYLPSPMAFHKNNWRTKTCRF